MLVGQSQGGRTADTIRSEAGWYGVADRVTVLSHVTNETLADCLCRAKVSVILSRREGSCVVVAESMFADTPVALLEGAEVGSAAFINERTGRFLPEHDLAAGLSAFLAAAETYAPRQWAGANISCHRSTEVLNGLLRDHQLAAGGGMDSRPGPALLAAGPAARSDLKTPPGSAPSATGSRPFMGLRSADRLVP